MPKTYKNLFEQIYQFDNLYNAYLKARKGKRYIGEVLEFTANLEENLISIQNDLINQTYQTGRYREFYVYDPKLRLVAALPFRDRVMHHAVCNIIEPIFEKVFIYDSYACRVNKGTHAGANRVTSYLRKAQRHWPRVYCLKGDVKQYFPSINHGILKRILHRKISCPKTRWLLNEIIDSSASSDDLNPSGIPIGNLTSQLFANIYLNELDHFIKEDLCARYYVRYMDDFIILGDNKRQLWAVLDEIKGFLDFKLNLQLNGKTGVFPVNQGIDFLGYRIWATHRLIRKSSKKRMKRKLRSFKKRYAAGKIDKERINSSIQSWLGHCKHANTHNLRRRLLDNFIP
ncbi:RNA-directed DNA polymerase (Reverse transcriptase) [Desulforamulus reducens MI-1]|uniref:RNA-directed DNA polymerase (Reverse transcriptase) n=1 Tax=Desulforamulus reducens (strain ATCC BAA-1160 / DSM 100696 / MI-1) TaxID=349161 RepID=A4J3V8_DESRM|nr:RNA-directed DNA polymerase [Desulforamulus reducens]ABO49761.1 RNA-directed DNA polymerase (Reverse transcriptase) [Desulforamulus reducens MI-1]